MAHGMEEAQTVAALAEQPDGLTEHSPCCAWCGKIEINVMLQPEAPAKVLARGEGCPLSVVAYSAAREDMKGKAVQIVPSHAGGAPTLVVDGEPMDPLQKYEEQTCKCGHKENA